LKSENVSYVAADVSKADDAKRYIDKTVATLGKIDVLFSNAGNFGVVRPIHEYPEDVFDSVYSVHVKGAFLAAKYGVPQMNDGGSMIITSSYDSCRLQRGVRLRPEAATAQIHCASTRRRARLAACGG
jgi:NAD(P)-dependent dehydrogenase (short-subunit alcohol dehydrogenase family)